MADRDVSGLPFDEAIRYLRDKVRLPTEKWNDLWQGQHARAFMVAGATKDALLADFQTVLLKALEQGTTLADFRRDFDDIVQRHGWSYNGGRNWRTRVIFDTNLRTAYAAGHWSRIQENKAEQPYLRYVAILDGQTRPEHAQWHGTVRPVDDPWWTTHYPPNGWNCRCSIMQLSGDELEAYGFSVSPPPKPEKGTPQGIDAPFAYNPGLADTGYKLSDEAYSAWRESGKARWRDVSAGVFKEDLRGEPFPVDPARAEPLPRLSDKRALADRIAEIMGGQRVAVAVPGGGIVYVDARFLAEHLTPERSRYISFLPELLASPGEVWLAFEQDQLTGRVVLRQRVLKAVSLPGKDRYLLLSVQSHNGAMESWTMIASRDAKALQKERQGKLLYKAGNPTPG
jgi:SPP1 gp7 family putative phage head morphogenesis protein